MAKLTELTVTKGKTVRAGDREEWTRVEYSVKVAIECDEELQVIKPQVEGLVDGWLTAAPPPVTRPLASLPEMDPDELAKLPWKTYKSKEPCKPEDAGWIFRNTQGAEALGDLVEKHGNGAYVQIGSHKFECSFSGNEKQFIGRKPVNA
jgi:hypothetical protein